MAVPSPSAGPCTAPPRVRICRLARTRLQSHCAVIDDRSGAFVYESRGDCANACAAETFMACGAAPTTENTIRGFRHKPSLPGTVEAIADNLE